MLLLDKLYAFIMNYFLQPEKFDPNKVPTGRLKVSSAVQYGGRCFNKPQGVFWTSSYKQKFKGSAWTDFKK